MWTSSSFIWTAAVIISAALSFQGCGNPGNSDGGTGGGATGMGGGQSGTGGGSTGTGGGAAGAGGGSTGTGGGQVGTGGGSTGTGGGQTGTGGGNPDAGGCPNAPYLSAQDKAKSPRANAGAELLAYEATGAVVASDEVYKRVADELAAIKSTYPWLQGVNARPSWSSEVMVKFDGGSLANVALDGGYHDWDCVNAMYGANDVQPVIPTWVLVSFTPRLNIPLIIPAYEALPHVIYAEPNYYGGDGPDICLSMEAGGHAYIFYDGSGDCPAGCIERDFTGVRVDGDGGISLLGRWNNQDGGSTRPTWMTERSQVCEKALPSVFP